MGLSSIIQAALAAMPSDLRASFTFTRTAESGYDRTTDTFAASVPTSMTAPGTAVPLDDDELRALQVTVERSRAVILAALDCAFAPAPDQVCAFPDGSVWNVRSVLEVKPDGVNALVYRALVTR